ncbi:SDR family NAD(P)-dependent oxidoreductase, partial [Weissella paramesenteroides]
ASQFLQDNAGLPQDFADMIAGSQSVVKSGSLAVEPSDIEQYLGRPFVTIKESLQQLLGK